MAVKRYEPQDSGDKVRVSPKDLVNTLLVFDVIGVNESFKTRFAPEGKPAIRLNVASVQSGNAAFDQMWTNEAIVDALRPYVGDITFGKIEYKVSASSGYKYLAVAPVSDAEWDQAVKFLESHPDLFIPQQASSGAALAEEKVAETVGHW